MCGSNKGEQCVALKTSLIHLSTGVSMATVEKTPRLRSKVN